MWVIDLWVTGVGRPIGLLAAPFLSEAVPGYVGSYLSLGLLVSCILSWFLKDFLRAKKFCGYEWYICGILSRPAFTFPFEFLLWLPPMIGLFCGSVS